MAIENAQVLRLVARLVMDYLDEQDLTDAYNIFGETSRHLTNEEYEAYSQGIKTIDNGYGLVNIVTEYFLIKDKLRDFIRSCPKTSIIINLIDTANLQSRLDIILNVLKDNLLKFDQVQEEVSRKRRKTENELFEVSQTNTSTPETVQPLKKRRISCSKSNTLNNSNNNDNKTTSEKVLGNKDLKSYISSPETSNKEDDVTEDESSPKASTSNTKKAPPPELLSETILKKPDFAENLAEIINKTLAVHDKSTAATSSQNMLTQNDVQDILSKTENDFEDILKEVIDKYLIDGSDSSKVESPNLVDSKGEELTIKQRLRPRNIKKILESERKKKKKINIISNEIYTGPMPLCVNMPPKTIISPIEQTATTSVMSIEQALNSHPTQSLVLVPIMQSLPSSTTTFIPLQSFHSTGNITCENNVPVTTTADLSNVQIILTENNPALPNIIQNNANNNEVKEAEKVQKTPKSTIQTNFLESKCKSTPRRKATHVRILDFTHTPSGRLAAIKECKTPSNSSIRHETPGSAPASIMTTQRVKNGTATIKPSQTIENGDKSVEIVDESSNSNSISNTPKVAKNRRRRKIEIDSKSEKAQEDILSKPMTAEEWIKMREEQKSLSVDERMRILFQQNEEKTNVKKRKTPKKKKQDHKKPLKKAKPLSTSVQHSKGKLCAKFKVTSPRKSALLRKSPKKKRLSSGNIVNKLLAESAKQNIIETQKIDETKTETQEQLSLPKLMTNESLVEDKMEETDTSDLNRSDTVQEVANLLTNLPETILAKTNSGNSFEIASHKTLIDASILMETPLKLDSISPLPNTPRFAVPLISTHQETPIAKEIIAITTVPSILKVCDILTPSFPITPGFKVTPAKSEASPSTGYTSRKTDYSSCSSYYKPDESEEINLNIESIIKQRIADRSSQSESEAPPVVIIERNEKIRTGSVKKVECPGAFERVLSFTEEQNAKVIPHYNMNEEGLLSESMITTASDESSSSFTCSTCSTDPSSDENTMDKLNKASIIEDRDSEWHCEEEEMEIPSNKSLVDERTGEVRFPLRSWITPKKIDPQEPKLIIDEMKTDKILVTIPIENIKSIEEKKEEQRAQAKAKMEAIKQRTINILKKESTSTKKELPNSKFKKSNVKQFKLPAEQPKYVPLTRRDQILQSSLLTERPKSTALKLIPSASTSSSSRRKCLTPRKTIIMDELPKADPTVRKVSNKKRQSNEKGKSECVKIIKSPAKPEKVSVENINDNAMMHGDHPSLNISTSFHESSEEDHENTVVDAIQKTAEEGSNTFQRTLIAQGFEKSEAKDLQIKFVDKIEGEMQKAPVESVEPVPEKPKDPPENNNNNDQIKDVKEQDILEGKTELNLSVPESESETEEDEEDECDFAFADILEKNVFTFEEPADFVPRKEKSKIANLCAPSKLQIDGRTVKIDFCNPIDIFTIEPTTKLTDDKNGKKEQQKEILKTSEPKILAKEISIDKILTMIHGNH